MEYKYRRSCKCGNVDFIKVNKMEASFMLRLDEIDVAICSKCGSNKSAVKIISPEVVYDKEVFLEWGNSEVYKFLPQDEDLMLVEEEYVQVMLDVIDNHQILEFKKDMLFKALSDILFISLKHNNINLAKEIALELKKRESQVINALGFMDEKINDLALY